MGEREKERYREREGEGNPLVASERLRELKCSLMWAFINTAKKESPERDTRTCIEQRAVDLS